MIILLKFHQCLTDIILCLGLIYYYSENSEELIVIMRSDTNKLMEFCFRNNKNIKFKYFVKDKDGINETKKTIKYTKEFSNYIYKLHSFKRKNIIGGSYDFFYRQHGLPNNYSHSYFNIPRDLELENKISRNEI